MDAQISTPVPATQVTPTDAQPAQESLSAPQQAPPTVEAGPMAATDIVPPSTPEPSYTVDAEPSNTVDAPKHHDISSAPLSSTTPLDPQSLPLQPIEHNAPGISSVAAFLPADAKLDHPTPSPSEPLGDGAADVSGDIIMGDARPLPDTSSSSARNILQQQTQLPDDDALRVNGPVESGASPVPQSSLLPMQHSIERASSVMNSTMNGGDGLSPSGPADTSGAVTASTIAATPPPPPPTGPGVDTNTGLTRGRDDDGGADERAAKRTKMEDPAVPLSSEALPLSTPDAPSNTAAVASTAASSATIFAPPTATSAGVAAPPTNGTIPGQLPSRSHYSTEPLTKLQKKLLEEKIKNTKKVKSAGPFLRPVDPVALNIPHYTNVIRTPMDIGTMEHKLKTEQYESLEDFVGDFELMVKNCFVFNGPAHAVSVMAQNLRAYFLKQMDGVPTGVQASVAPRPMKKESPVAKSQPRRESRAEVIPAVAKSPVATTEDRYALMPTGVPQIRRDSTAGRPKRTVIPPPSRDLPYSGVKPKRKEHQAGLKFVDHVLDELRKPKYHQMTMFFLEPVDPVALNIPHYFSVIKHPMDIATITNKQKTGQYSSAEDFKNDLDLMLSNCFKFNPPENGVHIAGKQLQGEFDVLWRTKSDWVKKNQPRSQRVTPTSDDSASEAESSEEEVDNVDDEKEATIRALKEQLATMQNMLGAISGAKRESPKASSKKKSRASTGGTSKPKKSGASVVPKAVPKSKNAKKQRLVTYEEKQEISNATENMTEEQANKLTAIITENVAKYKNMTGDDVELEIDDLPNEVQHKLLKYVRSIFPRQRDSEPAEDVAVDDDYEPANRTGKGGKRKHKPMKKAEQDSRIAQLSAKVEAMKDGVTNGGSSGGAGGQAQSSDDEDSESSEEE